MGQCRSIRVFCFTSSYSETCISTTGILRIIAVLLKTIWNSNNRPSTQKSKSLPQNDNTIQGTAKPSKNLVAGVRFCILLWGQFMRRGNRKSRCNVLVMFWGLKHASPTRHECLNYQAIRDTEVSLCLFFFFFSQKLHHYKLNNPKESWGKQETKARKMVTC